ncbi:MAG: esterase family protein [Armatimonadetes bacterium]|nr:esterase family protein [Armatimonadota bacterium]
MIAREYGGHASRHLGRDMEYLVFGHAGAPVLVFPTSSGRFFQWEDFSMVATLHRHLANGWIQLFCVESVDAESWYGFHLPQWEQIDRHLDYEAYLVEEFLPFLRQKNPIDFLIVTGTSFGAFHALNFSLRHPDQVRRVIALSGDFESKKYVDGYFDDEVYYNSPQDFLGGMKGAADIERLRNLDIILAAGKHDFCMGPTLEVSAILQRLGVPHRCDIWEEEGIHDWPLWKRQILVYI